jgi:tRNA dimethylallyltransferase
MAGPLTRIVCLAGATGTGKTDAALALAERTACTVVNFDSRQVYRDLPVITAQPTPGERDRCPHRLYGFLGLDQGLTAAEFSALADREITGAVMDGRTPVLVGGTGLYLRVLLRGLAPVPAVPEEVRREVQAELAAFGPEPLHARLAGLDPDSAGRIHVRDRQRITRALEVVAATGKPLTWWHGQQEPGSRYDGLILGLGLDLAELTVRLATRIDRMIEAGALDEVARALELCPDETAPGYTSIGCPEAIGYLRGRLDLARARDGWLRNTRAYAKRQMTWFKADRTIRWFRPGEHEAMAELALRHLDGR